MSDEMSKTQRSIIGRVVSDKANKTRTVLVERRVRHPLYGKFIRRSTRLYVHDEGNESRLGDTVRVRECRPLSRLKRFALVEVVSRAQA
ncbi:SSU ribosomal protein S17p (S11e) [Thioalkalivibrio nitratireducens DSM 14787]|uniref:Small ribosomal subunit protein uS17 n=1 Tax=Thioalkalivibrio nitratireducens (strain DSM 14787 / UNIQEM 213 / ALEN2) TaxID=1255043 RepID=L0E0N0_THIND|nr:30S ribosomal protein S17 [Thioalkalivibrio nitratireducens]AGA34206.1 SSU ribosomal protein S17p (S11e) [Thioalkalivibrio nitratireducens DSM 14787]